MRRLLLTSVSVAALMSTTAMAGTASLQASGMGLLENEWVKAGINTTTGTLGSGNGTSPGLLFDPTGTGTFNPSYDYLTPGSPFDGFAVKVDGTNYYNNNAGNQVNITKSGDGTGDNVIAWDGSVSGVFDLTNNYVLLAGNPYIDITTSITMSIAADSVSFAKYIDPDSQGMPGDSSATDNVLGYGVIPSTNVAFSEATVSRYALGIYTTDTNVTAGVENWTQEADGYSGTNYTDADGNALTYGTSDDTIGISWTWTGVSAGDVLTASYAYIFGPSAFDAADDAVSGGAGGGDTTVTDGWGTVTDVGSATDAAESGATGGDSSPTVVSTSTETITSTSEATSTTLPVLTASLTHHEASIAGGVQTVDREKTTTVTTPVNVTTTSFVRTTTTYSDGSTTTSDGEATSTVVVRNDVVSSLEILPDLSGRIDQQQKMDAIGESINRGMHVDPFKAGGAKTEWGQMWAIGGYGKTKLDNSYEADTQSFGLQIEFQPMAEWRISLGVAKSHTDLSGTGSSSDLDKINVNIGSIYDLGSIILVTDAGIAKNEYTNSRDIDVYSNASQSEGTDMILKQRVYYKLSDSITPFVGGAVTRTSRDAYAESGWVVTAREVGKVEETTEYGEAGVRLQHSVAGFDVFGQGSITTDEYMTASAGISYEITENASVSITANGSKQDDMKSVSGNLSANIKF